MDRPQRRALKDQGLRAGGQGCKDGEYGGGEPGLVGAQLCSGAPGPLSQVSAWCGPESACAWGSLKGRCVPRSPVASLLGAVSHSSGRCPGLVVTVPLPQGAWSPMASAPGPPAGSDWQGPRSPSSVGSEPCSSEGHGNPVTSQWEPGQKEGVYMEELGARPQQEWRRRYF